MTQGHNVVERSRFLACLTRDRLLDLARTLGAPGLDDLSRDAIIERLVRVGKIETEALLDLLDRDELKQVCRTLGLDDRGPRRAVLARRILKAAAPPDSYESESNGSQAATTGGTVPPRVFSKDRTTVYCGDAVDVLPRIPDGSVDLIFADPPYNLGKRYVRFTDRWPTDDAYAQWCKVWLRACFSKLSPTGSLYLMASTQSMPYLDIFVRQHLDVMARIVWHYDSSGVQAKKSFGSLYEPILYAVKNRKKYTFNADAILVEAPTGAKRKLIDYRKAIPGIYSAQKVPGNVWYFPRVRYRMPEYEEHPTQKPEALLERILLASTHPGDVVLDPFAGTFTTCAVAQRLGRTAIGIEKELEYVKIGLRRLSIQRELDGQPLRAPKKTYHRVHGKKA